MTLQHHKRPIHKTRKGKWTSAVTPYRFSRLEANGWRIGFGLSSVLVAQGAGGSVRVGKKLLRDLEDDWLLRRKKRMPKK